jgi:anti-anti-sigma regulatory factor
MLEVSALVTEEVTVMSITIETDPSGRRAHVTVSDDPGSVTALMEVLRALRWDGIDEIVVDLSEFRSIGLRVADVLAQASRHHEEVGRTLSIVCRPGADTHSLRTAGLATTERRPHHRELVAPGA